MDVLRIVKNLYVAFLSFINGLIKKPRNSVMFFPHGNCYFDNYDVINFHSDNVLSLLNFVLNDKRYNSYQFYIVYYHPDRLNDYIDYCKGKHPERINFVYRFKKSDFIKSFIKCRTIFTDNYYEPIRYKASTQRVVCLGYFAAPFKDDFFKIERTGYKNSLHKSSVINSAFDYHITNSDMCSRLIALDSLIFYPKFLPLGFPRNDLFYDKDMHLTIKNKIASCIENPFFDRILCYAPTYRDFENEDNALRDSSLSHSKTIFGSADLQTDGVINVVLEKTNSILIAKLHPKQEHSVIIGNKNPRIVMYSDLLKRINISLQELLAVSDLLITDYSSTFYDFLHLDRPVLYYFYDINKMTGVRRLFVDPISPLCAGNVSYTIDELAEIMEKTLIKGEDSLNSQKRQFVFNMINKYQDGNSAKRIAEYFLN